MKQMKMLESGNVQFLSEEAMEAWAKGFKATMEEEGK